MSLSKRIRDLRYAKGWGPDDLAAHSGLSRTALYNIERDRTRRPHAATLRQIAAALDVPIEALIAGAEDGDRDAAKPIEARQMSQPPHTVGLSAERLWEIQGMFLDLLDSPLGEGVALLVEQSYRLLPPKLTKTISEEPEPVRRRVRNPANGSN
jgi:transcriptional regulator with XRE-family HTH domain